MKIKIKTMKLRILAQSVDSSGSQGKNRVLVITQSTLGWGLINITNFLINRDKGKKLRIFKF
jgi:hypothetical protein